MTITNVQINPNHYLKLVKIIQTAKMCRKLTMPWVNFGSSVIFPNAIFWTLHSAGLHSECTKGTKIYNQKWIGKATEKVTEIVKIGLAWIEMSATYKNNDIENIA